MSRRKWVIGLVALAVAAFSGGAYAATQSGTNSKRAFLNDLAKRLNVTPTQLQSAIRAALLDRLDAAVKAGELTQAQANRIKQRIEQGAPVPFFFGPRPLGRSGFHSGATLSAAAGYLGISESQLLGDLRSGQTLAQIAKARGKSLSGLERAITAAVKARLDRAVAAGRITKAQENELLRRLSFRLNRRLNAPPRPGWGPERRWGSGASVAPLPAPAAGPELAPPPATPPPAA